MASFTILHDTLLQRNDLSLSAKLVLARLVRYAHKNGTAYPTQDRLAGDLGVSP